MRHSETPTNQSRKYKVIPKIRWRGDSSHEKSKDNVAANERQLVEESSRITPGCSHTAAFVPKSVDKNPKHSHTKAFIRSKESKIITKYIHFKNKI